jgi:hypothetical protein
MNLPTYSPRDSVLEQLAMLASTDAQKRYGKDVPHAFVPAELIEMFVTDIYQPERAEFVAAFSETELKALTRLYELLCSASEIFHKSEIRTVSDLQWTSEWREVMTFAKRLDEDFRING